MAHEGPSLLKRLVTGGQSRPFAKFKKTWVGRIFLVMFFTLLVLGTLHFSFRIALTRVRQSEKHMDSATASMLSGEFEDALYHYDQALNGTRRKRPALAGKGLALMYLKRYDESLVSFERLIVLNRNNAHAWQGKGMSLEFLGRYDEALASFDMALDILPTFELVTRQRDNLRELMKQ